MTRLYPATAYYPEPDPGNYWLSTIDRPETTPLQGDVSTETAIIGAGFTGLSAALQLVEKHGIKATVLDAAFPGWGASGRNGGFVCFGGSKLGAKALISRFGEPETRRFYAYQSEAIEQVSANLQAYEIDADSHSDGEWAFAHRRSDMQDLQEYARELNHLRGLKARVALVLAKLRLPDHEGALSPADFLTRLLALGAERIAELFRAWKELEPKHSIVGFYPR